MLFLAYVKTVLKKYQKVHFGRLWVLVDEMFPKPESSQIREWCPVTSLNININIDIFPEGTNDSIMVCDFYFCLGCDANVYHTHSRIVTNYFPNYFPFLT